MTTYYHPDLMFDGPHGDIEPQPHAEAGKDWEWWVADPDAPQVVKCELCGWTEAYDDGIDEAIDRHGWSYIAGNLACDECVFDHNASSGRYFGYGY